MSTKLQIPSILVVLILSWDLVRSSDSEELLPIKKNQAYVPYGVYVIRSKWGCLLKDSRCDESLALTETETEAEDILHEVILSRENAALWEITPFEGGVYQIVSKEGCDKESRAESCDAMLSHRNGHVYLDGDYQSFWSITKDQTNGLWSIRSANDGDRKGQSLNFNSDLTHTSIELHPSEMIPWEILLDVSFIEYQRMEDVQFDLEGNEVRENLPMTLASDEVHNLADHEAVNNVDISYQIKESFKFDDWEGFVAPKETEITLKKPIFTGDHLELSDYVSILTNWREFSYKINEVVQEEEVTVPPMSYKMLKITANEGWFRVPFNAILRQDFKTGKSSSQYVRGLYSGTQIFNIGVIVGEAVPLPTDQIPEGEDGSADEIVQLETTDNESDPKIMQVEPELDGEINLVDDEEANLDDEELVLDDVESALDDAESSIDEESSLDHDKKSRMMRFRRSKLNWH